MSRGAMLVVLLEVLRTAAQAVEQMGHSQHRGWASKALYSLRTAVDPWSRGVGPPLHPVEPAWLLGTMRLPHNQWLLPTLP